MQGSVDTLVTSKKRQPPEKQDPYLDPNTKCNNGPTPLKEHTCSGGGAALAGLPGSLCVCVCVGGDPTLHPTNANPNLGCC